MLSVVSLMSQRLSTALHWRGLSNPLRARRLACVGLSARSIGISASGAYPDNVRCGLARSKVAFLHVIRGLGVQAARSLSEGTEE